MEEGGNGKLGNKVLHRVVMLHWAVNDCSQVHSPKECCSVRGFSFYVHLKRFQAQTVTPHGLVNTALEFWATRGGQEYATSAKRGLSRRIVKHLVSYIAQALSTGQSVVK